MQFHMNLPKAHKWLAKLPKRPAQKKKADGIDVEAEFREWTEDLTRRGFFKPSYTYVVLKIAEPILMYAIGCYLMAKFQTAWSIAAAVVLVSLCYSCVLPRRGANSQHVDLFFRDRSLAKPMSSLAGFSTRVDTQALPQTTRYHACHMGSPDHCVCILC